MAPPKADKPEPFARLATVLPYRASYFDTRPSSSGRFVHTYQRSFLPLLAGEYMALGASKILIPADDPTADYEDELCPGLKSHIQKVDDDGSVRRRVDAFMEPIIGEIAVEFSGGGYFARSMNPNNSPTAVRGVIAARASLHKILLGIKYYAQLDLDLESVRAELVALNEVLRSAEARMNVSRLLGILNSYQRKKVTSLTSRSQLEKDRVRDFEELVNDHFYRKLSESGYFLGVSGMVRRAIVNIGTFARQIVTGREKSLFKLITRPVHTALGKIIDTTALLELLLGKRADYLPPIAWFSGVHASALRQLAEMGAISAPPENKTFILQPHVFRSREELEHSIRTFLGARSFRFTRTSRTSTSGQQMPQKLKRPLSLREINRRSAQVGKKVGSRAPQRGRNPHPPVGQVGEQLNRATAPPHATPHARGGDRLNPRSG
jgi:hypothetical protein